ncbi:MAG: single-stranded DNA-binding protein [Bacillota bacterium]|nr:single-stranded DNA-binding protein [Bacillota bacterium]
MNSVALVGRLTRDPELRYTAGTQTAVATFTLAVDRPFSKNNETDFIRIVVYGRPAENCGTYLAKGSLVGVQGRIQTGSYETKTGEKRYTTDVIADRVEFLQRPQGAASSSYEGRGRVNNQAGSGFESAIPDGFHAFDDDDDENIPF